MATAIDKAIAKLDELMLAASGANGANAAAVPAAAAAKAAAPAPAAAAKAAAPAAAAAAAPAAAAAAAPAAAAASAAFDPAVFAQKVIIKVARVLRAGRQENSEKLLKLKVDLGAGDERQVMAGLAAWLRPEDLEGRLVCVVANLKPAKLAGEPSEAMVLAAEVPTADGGLLVRLLVPPEGSEPGDAVAVEGAAPPAAPPGTLKPDAWRKLAPGLRVANRSAAFAGQALVTARGRVGVPDDVPDGSEIH